jgi:endonuclease YncB( thermonuclease family)
MHKSGQTLFLMLALALPLCAGADFSGKVVGVADGDTITVLDAGKRQHRIRLAGIDAPEKGQAFGLLSKENLAKWIYERDAVIEDMRQGSDGKLVAKVYVDGHDAGLEQVRAGLAWWDRAHAAEQAADDRELYELAETEARAQKRRLWRDHDPVPPWEWRRGKTQ